ncbi:MAG: hypothetical protein U0736_26280 [Gemmataceae bacterium]
MTAVNEATVLADRAVDRLTGGDDRDWFLFASDDILGPRDLDELASPF